MIQLAFRSTSRQKILRELLNKAQLSRISYDLGAVSSLEKLKLQSVSGRQKAADYVKILNDLILTQEGRHLCGEEWIFQQGNAAIHNASIARKYLLEPKIRLLDYAACPPNLNQTENLWDW